MASGAMVDDVDKGQAEVMKVMDGALGGEGVKLAMQFTLACYVSYRGKGRLTKLPYVHSAVSVNTCMAVWAVVLPFCSLQHHITFLLHRFHHRV